MMFTAGFAEVSITPERLPISTYLGRADKVLDPLHAQCACFDNGVTQVLVFSVNVVMLEFPLVDRIRSAVSAKCGVPVDNILLSATHNHACPAVITRPQFPREDDYLDFLGKRLVECAVQAQADRSEATLHVGRAYEKRINFNRRFVKRDGSVVSEPDSTRDLLFNEGVVDPEVGVCRISGSTGILRAILVNFACHAVHLMGSLSGGYPGALVRLLKKNYGESCVILFLNGPCGNVIHRNFENPQWPNDKDFSARCLAEDVISVLDAPMEPVAPSLAVRNAPLHGLYRPLDELRDHVGNMKALNVLPHVDQVHWYEWSLAELERMHAVSNGEGFAIQTFLFGTNFSVTALPCEYFSQYALRIKEHVPARYVFLAAPANGWLGYVPFSECFKRPGGHETTTAYWSKMAHDTGDRMETVVLSQLLEG